MREIVCRDWRRTYVNNLIVNILKDGVDNDQICSPNGEKFTR